MQLFYIFIILLPTYNTHSDIQQFFARGSFQFSLDAGNASKIRNLRARIRTRARLKGSRRLCYAAPSRQLSYFFSLYPSFPPQLLPSSSIIRYTCSFFSVPSPLFCSSSSPLYKEIIFLNFTLIRLYISSLHA